VGWALAYPIGLPAIMFLIAVFVMSAGLWRLPHPIARSRGPFQSSPKTTRSLLLSGLVLEAHGLPTLRELVWFQRR